MYRILATVRLDKAKIVLTSKDPEYEAKVQVVQAILANLGPDEAFFSIDEYGPFAVKRKGGVKRVAPGEKYTIPQQQRSKGCLIVTAALELSRNQITHFYSGEKNTDEMIKLISSGCSSRSAAASAYSLYAILYQCRARRKERGGHRQSQKVSLGHRVVLRRSRPPRLWDVKAREGVPACASPKRILL